MTTRTRRKNKPNRREPNRKPPALNPGDKIVRFVCSDKGQHPEVSFGHVVVSPLGDGWHVRVALDHRGREYVDLEPLQSDQFPLPDRPHKTYPLKCRRCGRDTPLRVETVERIAVDFAVADTPKFDLSDLP